MALVKKCRHQRSEWPTCGCTWMADIRVDGRRRYVNLGRNLSDARREHRALVERLASGTVAPVADDEAAFVVLSRRWMAQAERRVGPNTAHAYRCAIAHADRWLGDTDVRAITPAMLAEMEADLLAQGSSPSYVRQVRIATRQVIGFAADLGLVEEVPSMRRHRLDRNRSEPRFLNPAEVERVIADLVAPYDAMTEFAWLTGVRPGELVGLEGRDVEGQTIHVRRTVHTRTGAVGPTKSRRNRTVDLSPRALARLPQVEPSERLWDRTYTPWLRYWHDSLTRCGIERCGLHALRHSNASLRIRAGQDLVYVADQLGHSNAGFTLKVYGHLLERPESQADRLDATAAQLAS